MGADAYDIWRGQTCSQQNLKFALTVSITVGLNCNRDGSTVDGFMNAFRSLMSNSVFFAMHMAHKSSHHSDGKKT